MYRLLIVDDEWVIREGLEKTIPWEEWGIICVGSAKNGAEALSLIENNPVDILLTDIRMPGIDGLDLIEVITQKEQQMKVVILTGHNEFDYAQRALRLGADDFLLKPTNYDELKKTIHNLTDTLNNERNKSNEMLAVFIKKFISNPTVVNINKLNSINELKANFGIVKIDLKNPQPTLGNFDQAVAFNHNDLETYYLFHSIADEAHWQEEIKMTRNKLTSTQCNANVFVSLLVTEVNQLIDAYTQAKAANELIYSTDDVNVYMYFDNKHSLNIENALLYIDGHYDQVINQIEIATKFNISNSYFSKLFKQHTGMNFIDYITEKRMETAKHLLTTTDLKIYEIAEKIGYSETRYFNQLFKRRTNLTPSEYRTNTIHH